MDENLKYCYLPVEDKSFYYDHVHIVWDEQITIHQGAEWELSYIITGSGTRIIGDNMETFSKGEIIFIPPTMPHGWYFNQFDHDSEGKIENITILFQPSILDTISKSFPETTESISRINQYEKGVKFEANTLKALQKIMVSMKSENNMVRLSSFLNILNIIGNSNESKVVGYSNKQNKNTAKMQEVTRFIIHNFQRKISLDEIAQNIGMNRSSFCTFYKKEKGKSFLVALTEYRLECACLMLRETEQSISEICFAVGFEDVPHFNRTFKKIKGETPTNYKIKKLWLK